MQRWDYNTTPLGGKSDEYCSAAYKDEDASFLGTEECFAGVDTESQLTRQRASAPPVWLIIVVFLSFFALTLICWPGRGRRTQLGALQRRLAGADKKNFDFFNLPASPELDALCAEAAGWNPVEPQPGVPRQSPLMVQKFLEAVKQEQGAQPVLETGSAPAATLHEPHGASGHGSSTSKRPVPSASDLEDEPGPSWKVARFATSQQQLAPFMPVREGLTASKIPFASSPGTCQHHTSFSLHSNLHAGSGQSSFSAASSGHTAEQQHAGSALSHVSVRLPASVKGKKPRDWMESWVLGPVRTRDVCQSILKMRELLRMPILSPAHFRLLMDTAEKLANYAYNKMRDPLNERNPYEAVRGVGMRFLVFNALYSAARVAGPDRPPWWDQVASAVSCVYNRPKTNQKVPRLVGQRIDFLRRLSAAVDQYKNFAAPDEEEVLDLLRILFFGEESSAAFRDTKWDSWRNDIA